MRNDIQSLSYLLYMLDLLDHLVQEEEPNTRVFELIIRTILLMKESSSVAILHIYELDLLALCGYELPALDCSACGQITEKMYYDLLEQEIRCRKCSQRGKNMAVLSRVAIEILNRLNDSSDSERYMIKLIHEIDGEIKKFLKQYITAIIGYELKSQNIVEELLI